MNIGDVFFLFRGDGTKLQVDAKTEGAKAGATLGNSMVANVKKSFTGANIGKGLAQGLGIAGAFSAVNLASTAVSTLTDFLGDSVDAASDLNETVSKGRVIFGQNAGAIEAWASTAATAFGQSKRQAIDTASGFAGLFATVGLGLDESTDMSKKLTVLGSDLASFFNTDVDTALQALKSGLSGESEPLRQFNVFLSETAVSAKLAQMGVKKTAGQFTEGQKATARYALILEQTGSAQGDFARTSDGMANQQRILAAEQENVAARLGEKLLPVMLEVEKTTLNIIEGVAAWADALDRLGGKSDGTTEALLDQVDAASALADALSFFNPIGKEMARQLQAEVEKRREAIKVYDEQAGAVHDMRVKEQADLAAVQGATDDTAANMEVNRGRIGDAMTAVGKSFTKTAKLSDTANARMRESWKVTADYIEARANELISDAFDPIIAADDLATTNIEVNATRKTLAIKATTDEQKAAAREARFALDSQMRDTATLLTTLASTGNTNSATFKTGLANLTSYAAGLKGPARIAVDAAIDEIHRLERVAAAANPTVTLQVKVPKLAIAYTSTGPHVSGRSYEIYDQGGRPDPFVPALIGRGPYQEMFIPDRPGTIIPPTQTEAIKSVTGGNTYNFTVALPTTARPDPFETAAQLRRLADFGVFAK